jgi:hypothetical protein
MLGTWRTKSSGLEFFWLLRYVLDASIYSSNERCPFTGPKMFCAGPNFLSQSKNLIAFSASSKTFVPAQKPISLNSNHLLFWHKMFVTGTICN